MNAAWLSVVGIASNLKIGNPQTFHLHTTDKDAYLSAGCLCYYFLCCHILRRRMQCKKYNVREPGLFIYLAMASYETTNQD